VLPQVQDTVMSLYSGWIEGFMIVLPRPKLAQKGRAVYRRQPADTSPRAG
jgi:hypothetical protein